VRVRTTDPEERRWLLIRNFYSSWKRFRGIFEEYERRVKGFSDRYKTQRSRLRLSPDDLASLIDFRALEDLRDREVSLLREISHDLFRSPDATDRFDHHVSIIYHELSALKEEHYTLREEFVHEERVEYDHLYREVNQYYPRRLGHIRNLYQKADRRLRQLLPGMSSDRVVVRSLFLFGADLLAGIVPGGLGEFYGEMYPGGIAEGYATAGDSFREAGFLTEAEDAYALCVAAEDGAAGGASRRKGRGAQPKSGSAPNGKSPHGKSPGGKTADGKTADGRTANGKSPRGKSPSGRRPRGKASRAKAAGLASRFRAEAAGRLAALRVGTPPA